MSQDVEWIGELTQDVVGEAPRASCRGCELGGCQSGVTAKVRRDGPCAPMKIAPGNGSIAERAAILARLRAADEHAAPVVDMDRLAATQRLRNAIDDMTATRQIGLDLRRDRRLELQLAVEGEA